jgi:phosphotransferase system IIB component
MDINDIAVEILDGIGGKQNVSSLTYCATRLRFVVNNDNKVDDDKVRQTESVKNLFHTRGQHQVVIGNENIKALYDALMARIKSDCIYLSKNGQIAAAIIEALGGAANLASLAYCATRLRLELHDNDKVASDKLDQINEVNASFLTRGQYQLVLGNKLVKSVYDQLITQVKQPVLSEKRQYSRIKEAAKGVFGKS